MRLPKLIAFTGFIATLMASAGADAQQIRGTPGAPDAVMTPNPFSLPAPTPPFTGTIMPNVGDSRVAWPPQVAAPDAAPNILVILTDDVGFGAPSTFGGVIPTPAWTAWRRLGCATRNSIPRRSARQPALRC